MDTFEANLCNSFERLGETFGQQDPILTLEEAWDEVKQNHRTTPVYFRSFRNGFRKFNLL